MRRILLLLSLFVLASPVAASARSNEPPPPEPCGDGNSLGAVECADLPVVESLDPEYTENFRAPRPGRDRPAGEDSPADCRPADVVFYAATDWIRLAQKLSADASACAEYFISVPPLVADKTQPRANQAHRIRALGPAFHALAEIHWASWATWVRDNEQTWYEAGLEARRRMDAAGYDVTQGDTWAINEFPSSVRRGLGTARSDAREFVRGLFEGDGTLPAAQGAVFVIGLGQRLADASQYKATLKDWLADGDFWGDMDRGVRFWSQEVYADARHWGVPGAPLEVRRDYLNDFLQHKVLLALTAPAEAEVSRTFLLRAYDPIANAAWQWDFGFGWTMISALEMQAFVSSQTHALRSFGRGVLEAPRDRLGYAWAPRNATGISAGDFVRQTGEILDRLAGAVHGSDATDDVEVGLGACGPPGEPFWCDGDLEDAFFIDAWKIFSRWE